MNAFHEAVIYLLVFRMAIVATGAMCIFLGYKLLMRPDRLGTGEGNTATALGKGDEQESISLLTLEGVEYERNGDDASAERSYQKAVKIMAEPLNGLAWSYYKSGRGKEAVGLATLAVQLQPNEHRYLDTLSKAEGLAQQRHP